MLIDTHSHIYLEEFDDDRADVIARARECGVSKVVLPNVDCTTIDRMACLADSDSEMFYVANGLHPTSVNYDYRKSLDEIFSPATMDRFANMVAIGEIGMDLYWDETYVSEQKEALDSQLALAESMNLPVIIHCRKAFAEIIDVLECHRSAGLKGVFHCFSEDYEAARKVLDLNFHIGVGGVLTYKKSSLPDVVAKVPLSRILLETDSPYLAPVPHRGKRNESAYVACVAEKLALLLNCDYEKVCAQTSENAKTLFSI